MTLDEEIRLRFEAFVYHESNTDNDNLVRCKNANKYFFDNQTGLNTLCEMILKMQAIMYKSLPLSSSPDYTKQFDRMNDIVKDCKEILKKYFPQ